MTLDNFFRSVDCAKIRADEKHGSHYYTVYMEKDGKLVECNSVFLDHDLKQVYLSEDKK